MDITTIVDGIAQNPAVVGLLLTRSNGTVEAQSGQSLQSSLQNIGFFWHLGQLLGEELGTEGLVQIHFTGSEHQLTAGTTVGGRLFYLLSQRNTDPKPLCEKLIKSL
jgi:hypothetical protein